MSASYVGLAMFIVEYVLNYTIDDILTMMFFTPYWLGVYHMFDPFTVPVKAFIYTTTIG